MRGHKEVVELLLTKDIKAVDKYGKTPLYYGTQRGYREVRARLFLLLIIDIFHLCEVK